MSNREITIIVKDDGEIEVDLEGFQGKGCSEIAQKIVEALGESIETSKKCEYYKPEIKEKQKIRRGH